ncbi:hypothetical protein SynWH8101_0994 [Synechococcus sp. WH 8101]|nr:hypothetical protein SynWH8101_0994 [Synechococcus sp. WH 8101]QNI44801.1 hypothetical protein SynRCC2555_01015 [Synechococcus sp. WH 8101]
MVMREGLERSGQGQSKTPEQSPRVIGYSRQMKRLVWIEAAGVGAWGRTFQVRAV